MPRRGTHETLRLGCRRHRAEWRAPESDVSRQPASVQANSPGATVHVDFGDGTPGIVDLLAQSTIHRQRPRFSAADVPAPPPHSPPVTSLYATSHGPIAPARELREDCNTATCGIRLHHN